jgi:hypothetical protein
MLFHVVLACCSCRFNDAFQAVNPVGLHDVDSSVCTDGQKAAHMDVELVLGPNECGVDDERDLVAIRPAALSLFCQNECRGEWLPFRWDNKHHSNVLCAPTPIALSVLAALFIRIRGTKYGRFARL